MASLGWEQSLWKKPFGRKAFPFVSNDWHLGRERTGLDASVGGVSY